jgi:hypothetical protein
MPLEMQNTERSKEAEKEKREESSKLARSRNDVTAVPINTI